MAGAYKQKQQQKKKNKKKYFYTMHLTLIKKRQKKLLDGPLNEAPTLMCVVPLAIFQPVMSQQVYYISCQIFCVLSPAGVWSKVNSAGKFERFSAEYYDLLQPTSRGQ